MTDLYTTRLTTLRTQMADAGCDVFVIPMNDEYQSEYPPASSRRIEFLTGFTGSAGTVVVTQTNAAFFTDGRYTLQAAQQVPQNLYSLHDTGEMRVTAWLEKNLTPKSRLGCDEWLHSVAEIESLRKICAKTGSELVLVSQNPLDATWHDRPTPPTAPVVPYDITFAGKSSADKRNDAAKALRDKNCDAQFIGDSASVAWLLNVRGDDTPNTPLPLSFAVLHADATVDWFLDARKTSPALMAHIGSSVRLYPTEKLTNFLAEFVASGKKLRFDENETPAAIVQNFPATAQLDRGEDLTLLPRACKNDVELNGMRAAHQRDGVALVSFFAWLESALLNGDVTELMVEEKLASFRARGTHYRGPSFDTIAGSGPHGAIVHYRATPKTNRRLGSGELFLLDSGGQYLDGTTDVTRTIAIGTPSPETRRQFTRVLKGHIALASIRFPAGTTGGELEILARQYLWNAGQDFAHGTGHGVGCYLGVHEGPQGISRRNRVPLLPGMILSNEPGYYKNGAYGIRIENLQAVTTAESIAGGDRTMMGFETLTLCPIDHHLIDVSLLTNDERTWLNAYHTRVRTTLSPHLDPVARTWLESATRAL